MKIKLLGLVSALALFASPAFAADLALDGFLRGQCGTITESGNAATLNNKCGVITTASITAPSGSEYLVTLTNSTVAAGDIVLWSVGNGSSTTGLVTMGRATVTASTVAFSVRQATATNFNGTLLITYFVLKP